MKRGFVVVTLILALAAISAVDLESAVEGKVVRVASPGSMFGRMHTVSRLFMKDQPTIKVDFMRSVNVDASFSALLEKSVDVALTTRRITAAEDQSAKSKGLQLTGVVIGHGGIVIVTSPRNPVSELTVEQVQKIFTGGCLKWSEVGGANEPITVVKIGGDVYPGTLFFMQQDFLGGTPFAVNAATVPEFAGVLRKVAETPGSIGFVRIRDAFETPIALEMSVKVLKIKKDASSPAVQPSRATIADAGYPIRRPYYVYYESNADANVMKYVEFVKKKGWGQQNP